MPIRAASLYNETTIQSADSIESHPRISGLFALGTYQVDQEDIIKEAKDEPASSSTSPEYSRKGTISLKKVKRSLQGDITCDTLCRIDTAAVLDQKWLSFSASASSILSVALADSHISLYDFKDESLERTQHIKVNDKGALCLSLDWSDRIGGNSEPSCIVSQSDGTLAYISEVFEGTSPKIETWHAHDYEAWTCAFDCWSGGSVLWSGGDDLTLKGWDIRTPCIDEKREATFQVKKGFEGGVTSLQSHHLRQHLWAVGSYDGGLRLFDARNSKRPLLTTQVGGGIWRIKWHPTKVNRLLLGCMHDGFKVMSLDSLLHPGIFGNEEMEINTRFDEHKSLAYGCDWDTSLDVIYSCSFYDATWHLWESN